MKGIERGLKCFSLVLKKYPDAKLWVIGRGEEDFINSLKKQSETLGIKNNVQFLGFKDNNEKFELLAKAHVLMNPSYLEGWGLVNIEANKVGTPAVVFDVRGCRDSVKNEINGYVSPDNNLNSMSENIIKIFENQNLNESSWKYSQNFNWDIQADNFFELLK